MIDPTKNVVYTQFTMADEEQRIWEHAYTVAFVAEYERLYRLFSSDCSNAKQNGNPWAYYPIDRALNGMSAELAGYIADNAVMRLRQWRETEDANMGKVIDWPSYRDEE